MSGNQPPDRRHPARSPFDVIRHVDEDPERGEIEWWSAREAMPYLGYKNWQNMENVIAKAKAACRNSGHQVNEHFIDVSKTPAQGGPRQRDVQMTRFGMYLLAMNGDPDKPEIAAAQRYFAIQTFRAERLLPAPQEQSVLPAPPVAPEGRQPAFGPCRVDFGQGVVRGRRAGAEQ